MNEYSTLSGLRTFLSLGSGDTTDDSQLQRFLITASRSIDRYTRRKFYPRRFGGNNTLKYDLPRSGDLLRFDEDILEVHGLSDVNGASGINESVYWLGSGDRWNISPYDRLIIDSSTGSAFNYSGTPQRAIHVDAVVGYNENYGDAWLDSNGSLTDALGSTVTIASVSSSANEDSLGLTPRFSANQIWKLGSGASEEYVYVKSTRNTSSVELIRGINGTSAVAHSASTKIYIWQVEPDIEFSAKELAAFMYHKAVAPFTNRVSSLQLGIIEMPEAWPEQTINRLKRFKKDEFSSL